MKIFGYILMLLGAIFFLNGLLTDPTGSAVRQIVTNMYVLQGVMLAILGQLIVTHATSKKDSQS